MRFVGVEDFLKIRKRLSRIYVEPVLFPWEEIFPWWIRYFEKIKEGAFIPAGITGVYVYGSDGKELVVCIMPFFVKDLLREWLEKIEDFYSRNEDMNEVVFSRELFSRREDRTEFASFLHDRAFSAEFIKKSWEERKDIVWKREIIRKILSCKEIGSRTIRMVFDMMLESFGDNEDFGEKVFLEILKEGRVYLEKPFLIYPLLLKKFSLGREEGFNLFSNEELYVYEVLKFLAGDLSGSGVNYDRKGSRLKWERWSGNFFRDGGRAFYKELENHFIYRESMKSLLIYRLGDVYERMKKVMERFPFVWSTEKERYISIRESFREANRFYKEVVIPLLSHLKQERIFFDLEGLKRKMVEIEEMERVEKDERRKELEGVYRILYDVLIWSEKREDEVRGIRGEVSPVYDPWRAVTGRVVVRCPAMFRLPKETMQELFDVVGFDYKQMEVRVFGSHFRIKSLMEFFNERNEDLYVVVGNGDRDEGKKRVMLSIYGGALDEGIFFEEEARARIGEILRKSGFYEKKDFAFVTGHGRIRIFDSLQGFEKKSEDEERPERRLSLFINSQIQGLASDLVMKVMKDFIQKGGRCAYFNQDCVYVDKKFLTGSKEKEEKKEKVRQYLAKKMSDYLGVRAEVRIS